MAEHTAALMQWAEEQLNGHNYRYQKPLGWHGLAGDAGFRNYYRLDIEPSLMAVHAPVATEDSHQFVAIARYLREQGVHTPEIVAVDFERGFLLVEDFGESLYSEALNDETVDLLYGEALMTLLRLQQCPLTTIPDAKGQGLVSLPDYDQPRLRDEMQLFEEWFVPKLLGYKLSNEERQLLSDVYTQLESEALRQPQVWVHRDYHSRNLIYREGNAPGVIDFQDAVRGPLTYDLVSLLRDCYVRWQPEKVERWALSYGNMAVECGLMAPVTERRFLRWFDWMGLQRHLKVLGIFARLHLRDGRDGYLHDLPLVIRYLMEVAENYVELDGFTVWFKEKILPLCEQQSWYSDYTVAGETAGVDV